MDIASLIEPAYRNRVRWDTGRNYDVLIQQSTTVNGGANTTGNAIPVVLEGGYYYLWYGTSGDVFTPAAYALAAGVLATAAAGTRWLWEPQPSIDNAATVSSYTMPHVGNLGITFKVNSDVLTNGFQPFHTFAGPSADRMRMLFVPVGLAGQTPISYSVQNNAQANANARSNVVMHTMRYALN